MNHVVHRQRHQLHCKRGQLLPRMLCGSTVCLYAHGEAPMPRPSLLANSLLLHFLLLAVVFGCSEVPVANTFGCAGGHPFSATHSELLRIARCDTTWCAEGRTFNAALIVQAGAVVTPPAFHSNFRGGTVCLNPIFDERVEKHVARWPFACSGRHAATTVRWAGGQTVNAAHFHQCLCSGMQAATTRWWAGGNTVIAV